MAIISIMGSGYMGAITEWGEFGELDYSGKIVIDGRRVRAAERTAKIYEGVCW
ncbi:hypothetical protein [Thermococcus sp. 5-4]|uniref:hypothetical protein n=1 Tax=Thermococcus sp. 5-4 TaxID=2008440 RepID=UPI001D042182|nr:hypothetical protein [Thermococcus sp. 5-4]